MSDIHERVSSDLAEQLSGKVGSAGDLRHEVETLEHDFDFDSFAPYTHQERRHHQRPGKGILRDAEDICGDKTYKATEWEEARRAYAGALAYTAYLLHLGTKQTDLIEAIEQFESDATDSGCSEPNISLSLSCMHGWAAHDREDEDGTMYFESRQLDGCNGLARKSDGVWMSVCFVPEKPKNSKPSSKQSRLSVRVSPVTAGETGRHSLMITSEQAAEIVNANDALMAWVDSIRGKNGWASYKPEDKPANVPDVSNEERSALEVFRVLPESTRQILPLHPGERSHGHNLDRDALGHVSFGQEWRDSLVVAECLSQSAQSTDTPTTAPTSNPRVILPASVRASGSKQQGGQHRCGGLALAVALN